MKFLQIFVRDKKMNGENEKLRKSSGVKGILLSSIETHRIIHFNSI